MYFCASGDPVIGHDLLELVLVARVAEGVRRREGAVAGLADYGRVVPAEVPAPVEVGEGDVVIGGRRHGRVGVLLIGQRLIAQRLNRIGDENRAGASATRADAGCRGAGCRRGYEPGRGYDQQQLPHDRTPT